MLDIVTFKWDTPGYRSKFTGEHVNIMARMVQRCYPAPHRFHVVTDNFDGITEPGVWKHGLWNTFADLPNPHGPGNPSCFRRLVLWSPWGIETFGPRTLQIDLDMVLCGDVRPLWDRPEPVVKWADNLNPTTPYNGAMQLFSAAERPQVWRDFDPAISPRLGMTRGYFGSDQGWLSYALGPGEARWTVADGAVSWRVHCRKTPMGQAHMPWQPGCEFALPENARVVNFHGIDDPWTLRGSVPWIAEHYK